MIEFNLYEILYLDKKSNKERSCKLIAKSVLDASLIAKNYDCRNFEITGILLIRRLCKRK